MSSSGIGLVFSKGPQFVYILSFMVVLWLGVVVLFSLQSVKMKRAEHLVKEGSRTVRSLSTIMSVMGIGMSILTFLWIVFSFLRKRDELNIKRDTSTLLVSRNNIYTNFNVLDESGDYSHAINSPNTGGNTDHLLCFDISDGDKAHQVFFDLAKRYTINGENLQIKYKTVGGSQITQQDNLDTQQRRSLAYYRFMYCMTSLMSSALAKDPTPFQGWTSPAFLNTVLPNMDQPGNGCDINGDNKDVPDWQYCLDSSWKTGTPCGSDRINPCYRAMIQTFSAQCLLNDDIVSAKIGGSTAKTGALGAFGLTATYLNSYP